MRIKLFIFSFIVIILFSFGCSTKEGKRVLSAPDQHLQKTTLTKVDIENKKKPLLKKENKSFTKKTADKIILIWKVPKQELATEYLIYWGKERDKLNNSKIVAVKDLKVIDYNGEKAYQYLLESNVSKELYIAIQGKSKDKLSPVSEVIKVN